MFLRLNSLRSAHSLTHAREHSMDGWRLKLKRGRASSRASRSAGSLTWTPPTPTPPVRQGRRVGGRREVGSAVSLHEQEEEKKQRRKDFCTSPFCAFCERPWSGLMNSGVRVSRDGIVQYNVGECLTQPRNTYTGNRRKIIRREIMSRGWNRAGNSSDFSLLI